MNGYELTNRMRKKRRRYPLTATEQALYNELVAICNEDEWGDTFSVSNQELCNALQITEKTLTVARVALIQAGLLFYKSGQSKRQFGKYSFLKDFVTSTVKFTVDVTTDKGGDNTANNTANPTAQASDYIKTETKLNETKKESSTTVAGATDEEKKEITRHWKGLVGVWFTFYQQKFSRKPTFNGASTKCLKEICTRLEKTSTDEGFEWTELTAKETLSDFLRKAWDNPWLKSNYLLSNLSSKYDSIINQNGTTTSTGKPAAGAKVTGAGLNEAFNKFYSKS